MSLGALHRVDHKARPRVLITHVLPALVTPVRLLDRNFVPTRNALHFLSHCSSQRNGCRAVGFSDLGPSFAFTQRWVRTPHNLQKLSPSETDGQPGNSLSACRTSRKVSSRFV